MKTYVITGSTSFFGRHLTDRLLNNGNRIYVVIRPTSKNQHLLPSHKNLIIISTELNELPLIKSLPESIDGFFHLAWDGVRGKTRDNENLQYKNLQYTLNAVKLAAKLNSSCFIGAGSQAEYGGIQDEMREDLDTYPLSMYGEYKLQACKQAQSLCESMNLRFVWPRIFSLYGPFDFEASLIMYCIRSMLENKSIQLSLCEQLWDYLYVKDAVELYIELARVKTINGIYNVASGDIRPLKSYVEEAKKVLNSKSQLIYGALPHNPIDSTYQKFNINKLLNSVSWRATTAFHFGVLAIKNYLGGII